MDLDGGLVSFYFVSLLYFLKAIPDVCVCVCVLLFSLYFFFFFSFFFSFFFFLFFSSLFGVVLIWEIHFLRVTTESLKCGYLIQFCTQY